MRSRAGQGVSVNRNPFVPGKGRGRGFGRHPQVQEEEEDEAEIEGKSIRTLDCVGQGFSRVSCVQLFGFFSFPFPLMQPLQAAFSPEMMLGMAQFFQMMQAQV